MTEKKKSKIKIDPYANISSYKQTPEKDVEVGGTSGRYGVKGEIDLGEGFKLSGGYGKSFDKGSVKYPGGSESWDAKIPDDWNVGIKWSKQFKYGGLSVDKPGLYANIHAKRKRIEAGSGEKMRKPGAKGAPTAKQFKRAAKTAKKK